MSKRLKTLLILCAVLLVLGGAMYFVFTKEEPQEEIQIDETIVLFEASYSDIDTLTIDSQDAGAFTLIKKETDWIVEGAEGEYELKQPQIDSLIYTLTGLRALSIVEEIAPDDLAPYGLEKPTIITADTIEGDKLIAYIGSQTTGNSYYAMVEDDPAVYEIYGPYGKAFTMQLNDYRVMNIMEPVDVPTLEYLLLIRDKNETVEIAIPESNNEKNIMMSTTPFRMIQPFNGIRDIRIDEFGELLSVTNAFITAKEIVEDAPQDLSKYGLDSPQVELTMRDELQDITLLFGDMASQEDNTIYYMLAGGNAVYATDATEVEYLKSVDAFDLVSHFVFLANIMMIDEVIIIGEKEEYSMSIDREPTENDENEDGQLDTLDTYYLNDKEVEEDDFKDTYQLVIGLYADAVAENATDINDAVISIEYMNNIDGADNDLVELVPYNEFFYAAYVNGVCEFVVAVAEIERMFEGLKNLT